MHVSALAIYPVKSARAVGVEHAQVEPTGLAGDRRWMVIGADGCKLSPPRHRGMLDLTARPLAAGLLLSAPGRDPISVPEPVDGPVVAVTMSRLESAHDAGNPAAAWLGELLGVPARLVWLGDPTARPVAESHGGRPGDVLSLADAGPVLLTSTDSLRQVERWAGTALGMGRFRPNVVVDGIGEPFAEDGWSSVSIGEVRFRPGELCDRCSVTLIDPATGTTSREPIRSLNKHRRVGQDVYFGVRLIPERAHRLGEIAVGDPVLPD